MSEMKYRVSGHAADMHCMWPKQRQRETGGSSKTERGEAASWQSPRARERCQNSVATKIRAVSSWSHTCRAEFMKHVFPRFCTATTQKGKAVGAHIHTLMIHTFQASGHGGCTEIEVQPTYPQSHGPVACLIGRSSGAHGLVEGPVCTLAQGGAVPRSLALAAAVACVRRAHSAHICMGRVTHTGPQAQCGLVVKDNGAMSTPPRGSGGGENLRPTHAALT